MLQNQELFFRLHDHLCKCRLPKKVPDSEAPEFTLGRFVEFSRKLLNQYASDFEAALENFLEMAGNLPPHIFSDAYV